MGSGARRALGAAVAACMLLCGCTPIRVVDPDATAPPSPSPSPSAGTAAWRTSSELPEVVTFAAGDGLRSGPWRVGWNHTRLWGGGYTYVLDLGEIALSGRACDLVKSPAVRARYLGENGHPRRALRSTADAAAAVPSLRRWEQS